jgi:glucose-6-phosphate isomerase
VLASKVRTKINEARNNNRFIAGSDGFNYSTTRMINKYLAGKEQVRRLRGRGFVGLCVCVCM